MKITKALQSNVATLTDLALSAKMAHWNVKGHMFHSLHQLFDQVYQQANTYTDEMAERLVQLDGIALTSVSAIKKESVLEDFDDGEQNQIKLIKMLEVRLKTVVKHLDKQIKNLGNDDPDTIDLLTEASREFSKLHWMVKAHLS